MICRKPQGSTTEKNELAALHVGTYGKTSGTWVRKYSAHHTDVQSRPARSMRLSWIVECLMFVITTPWTYIYHLSADLILFRPNGHTSQAWSGWCPVLRLDLRHLGELVQDTKRYEGAPFGQSPPTVDSLGTKQRLLLVITKPKTSGYSNSISSKRIAVFFNTSNNAVVMLKCNSHVTDPYGTHVKHVEYVKAPATTQ